MFAETATAETFAVVAAAAAAAASLSNCLSLLAWVSHAVGFVYQGRNPQSLTR